MNVSEIKTFNSQIQILNEFKVGSYTDEQIKNEPMFFNCDLDFAYEKGGIITKDFIDALPSDWNKSDVVFDSRIHMLMKGWYPCIPGWHHDDVGRTKEKNGQPDYDNLQYQSEHILALANADVCPTLFALGKSTFQPVPENVNIYEQWDEEVAEKVKSKELEIFECPDNTLILMNWETWHTGQKALKNGWRWFGRVSRNTERIKKITNEIRVNTQVYLEFPKKGW